MHPFYCNTSKCPLVWWNFLPTKTTNEAIPWFASVWILQTMRVRSLPHGTTVLREEAAVQGRLGNQAVIACVRMYADATVFNLKGTTVLFSCVYFELQLWEGDPGNWDICLPARTVHRALRKLYSWSSATAQAAAVPYFIWHPARTSEVDEQWRASEETQWAYPLSRACQSKLHWWQPWGVCKDSWRACLHYPAALRHKK